MPYHRRLQTDGPKLQYLPNNPSTKTQLICHKNTREIFISPQSKYYDRAKVKAIKRWLYFLQEDDSTEIPSTPPSESYFHEPDDTLEERLDSVRRDSSVDTARTLVDDIEPEIHELKDAVTDRFDPIQDTSHVDVTNGTENYVNNGCQRLKWAAKSKTSPQRLGYRSRMTSKGWTDLAFPVGSLSITDKKIDRVEKDKPQKNHCSKGRRPLPQSRVEELNGHSTVSLLDFAKARKPGKNGKGENRIRPPSPRPPLCDL